jgi:myo-inositol-1(or 4)-monophosphatase
VSDYLEFAIETARHAGSLLCELYHRQHTVRQKRHFADLVTEADVASEEAIVRAIRSRFPGHQILSEEGLGDVDGYLTKPGPAGSRPVWLVDPLDGTVNYAHGYDVWSVSMALAVGGRVQVGVILEPLYDRLWWSVRGEGAWCDASSLHVSTTPVLGKALLATGFPHATVSASETNLPEFNALAPRVHGIRRSGSAALDLAHVAAGQLDGYWEAFCSPWDWAAGWLLVEEAGGLITDWRGAPFTLASNRLVASNGSLHQELLTALSSV